MMRGLAYKTMTLQDVNYILRESKRYKELWAIREIAMHNGDQTKAVKCRKDALEIQLELYRKYDIVI